MNLQNELFAIFKKYEFIHIDNLGQLSILVPLTGAMTVNNNFCSDSENPVSLYLFGDNTCKSDLERRNFFNAYNGNFGSKFANLIKELRQLHSCVKSNDQEFITATITLLESHQAKALEFEIGNPGLRLMTHELTQNGRKIISKGEFIVTENPDSLRYLDLPNVLNISNAGCDSRASLLSQNNSASYLNNLSRIISPHKENSLINAITKVISGKDVCTILSNNPSIIFQRIYAELQKTHSFLKALDPVILAGLVENFGYLATIGEDFSTWPKQEIIDSILSVCTEAKLIAESQLNPMNTFAKIYYNAIKQFSSGNADQSRQNTYKLFVLQTFLYLCALNIRLKNPEQAKAFLTDVSLERKVSQLIVDLCTNETGLITRLHKEFGISLNEYQEIIASCYQIALAHLEAPHFDELRTACMPLTLEDTQYLVIGGCLCWSTAPITEYGNINSHETQSKNFDRRFQEQFSAIHSRIKRESILQELNQLLNFNRQENQALALLEKGIALFSDSDKIELLNRTITTGNYQCVRFLIKHGEANSNLFLDYLNHITIEHLIEAINARKLPVVEVLLSHFSQLSRQLNEDNLESINQQRYQRDLKTKFQNLLDKWQDKIHALNRAGHIGAHLTANRLSNQLTAAGDEFFSCQLSQDSINKFEQECRVAFDTARPILAMHRGWHGFPLFFRAVLGFIATVTIVPALIVHAVTNKGYTGTFFKCSESDSAVRLSNMDTEIQNDVCQVLRALC